MRKKRSIIMLLLFSLLLTSFSCEKKSLEMQYSDDKNQIDCETKEEKNDMPQLNIDTAKSLLMVFWRENQEALEELALEMSEQKINCIRVYEDSSLVVLYDDNTVSDGLRVSRKASDAVGQCKGDTVYLTDCEITWKDKGHLFTTESSYFCYQTRVFRDELSGIDYTIMLVYSDKTIKDLEKGFRGEELNTNWMLIVIEL